MILINIYIWMAILNTLGISLFYISGMFKKDKKISYVIKEIFTLRILLIMCWVFIYAGLGWPWHFYKIIIEILEYIKLDQ